MDPGLAAAVRTAAVGLVRGRGWVAAGLIVVTRRRRRREPNLLRARG